MSELTDLEIAKIIHEITGRTKTHELDIEYNERELYVECSDKPRDWYSYRNPLTDDALCFQLMIKYRISITDDIDKWIAFNTKQLMDDGITDKNPNKAILLAIIESQTLNKD